MVQPVTCSILLLAGCVTEHGPRLLAADPPQAQHQAMVSLTGTDLCDGDCATAAGEVLIGLGSTQIRAAIVSYDDALAVIAIPDLAPVGATRLVVSVRDASSNALAFSVLP
jgi:hypothetical protein